MISFGSTGLVFLYLLFIICAISIRQTTSSDLSKPCYELEIYKSNKKMQWKNKLIFRRKRTNVTLLLYSREIKQQQSTISY